MRKITMFSCAVALCFATATAILAQTDTKPNDADRNTMGPNTTTDSNGNTVVAGKVVSTTGSMLVIDTDAGNRMTFDTNGTTVPSGASVGTRVQVAYASNPAGNGNRVSSVTVMPATDTAIADAKYHTTGSAGTVGASMPTGDMVASNRNLPKTASLMPLVALLGVLALGTGLALRIVRSAF